MPKYFATRSAPDGRTFIYARDQHAQQCFFGWGSDKSAVEMAMYGNSNFQIQAEAPPTVGTEMTWRWVVGPIEARYLLTHYHAHKDDSDYYSAEELKRMAELEPLLNEIANH